MRTGIGQWHSAHNDSNQVRTIERRKRKTWRSFRSVRTEQKVRWCFQRKMFSFSPFFLSFSLDVLLLRLIQTQIDFFYNAIALSSASAMLLSMPFAIIIDDGGDCRTRVCIVFRLYTIRLGDTHTYTDRKKSTQGQLLTFRERQTEQSFDFISCVVDKKKCWTFFKT